MSGKYDVSAGRKFLYYGGMALMAVGFVLFISIFFTAIGEMARPGFGPGLGTRFGTVTRPGLGAVDPGASLMLRAVTGMLLVIAGGAMRAVGAKGLAGSGLVLSPKKAREDLEPWARMTGSLVDDALSEVDALKRPKEAPARQVAVKVRCRECGTLNDETAKFCGECGKRL